MILRSKIDTNKYVSKTLKNGMKALIVQNDIFTKSSCALTVNVGSFDEPDEFCGLAHFLEHMLFMGTAKYPGENMFSDFLSQHNGYSNAYTADEITTYYCDVDSEYFSEMADMFSQFFISPLFKKDTVEREISAVNSEFLNTLNNREWRIHALYTDLMKDDKKEKRFSCGNSETLRRENNLDAVIKFWKEMYSSDIMSLVICGNKSVEELEKILDLFEEIPNLNIRKRPGPVPSSAALSYENSMDLFKNEVLSKVVKFKPLDDKKEIVIRTILKPLRDRFKVNPLEFISFQLIKKEHDGLIHILKSKKLAFDLSFNYTYYSKFTDVRIQISLTDKGLNEFQSVLSILSEYLTDMSIEKREYDRLKRIEGEEFDFKPGETPIEIAENVCPNLLFYPIEYILKHEYVFEDFDKQLIEDCLKAIQDTSKWIILLSDATTLNSNMNAMSNSNENMMIPFDRMEKYYSIEYCILQNYLLLQDSNSPKEIKTPSNIEDEFIDDIKVINSENRYHKREVFDDGEVNLVFDSEFNVPKCEIFILLSSPEMRKNPLPYQIFFLMMNDSFHEKYGRFLTNVHVDISIELDVNGILIKLEGFSSKLIDVCKLFFKMMREENKYDNFEVIRQEIEDFYSEMTVESPYLRLFEVFNNKTTSSKTPEEFLKEIKTIKKETLNFEIKFHTKILAVGNIEYEKVFCMYELIRSYNERPIIEMNPKDSVIEFETSDKFNNGVAILYKINDCSEGIVKSDDNDSCSMKTSQCDDSQSNYNYNTAIGKFIHQISHEKFFNELRTIEEFGYVVYCTTRSFMSSEYLAFVVQSEKTVDFIEKRMLKFVEDLKTHISEMDDEEFEIHRESLIGFYEEPILNLGDFSKMLLRQFFKNRLDLDYEQKMIKLVKNLSKEEILSSKILNNHVRINSIRKE